MNRFRRDIWLIVPAALSIYAGVTVTQWYGQSQYEKGRRSVTANVRVDTVTVNVMRRADSTAKAATDGAMKRTRAAAKRVDSAVAALPDSALLIPEVATLKAAAIALTATVTALSDTLNVERAVSRLRASTDSAALVSATVVIAAKDDEITTLKKRPTWKTVAKAGVVGAVVWEGGKTILKAVLR